VRSPTTEACRDVANARGAKLAVLAFSDELGDDARRCLRAQRAVGSARWIACRRRVASFPARDATPKRSLRPAVGGLDLA